MRISDWSSDVCSSDLAIRRARQDHDLRLVLRRLYDAQAAGKDQGRVRGRGRGGAGDRLEAVRYALYRALHGRSEERRVGKACVSTCKSIGSPYHEKKKHNHTKRGTRTIKDRGN